MANLLLLGYGLTPFAFESIAPVASTGLTATNIVPADGSGQARRVLITVNSATGAAPNDGVRFRLDGVAPTASSGHLLLRGDSLVLESISALKGFRVIEMAASAQLAVTYFR